MPNGKPGDDPLTDLVIHRKHPFPADIEAMLWKADELASHEGWHLLGANWPFSPHEFDWERAENLDGARAMIGHLIAMLEAGRGGEILQDPVTQRPIREPKSQS